MNRQYSPENPFNQSCITMLNPVEQFTVNPLPRVVQEKNPHEINQGKWSLSWEDDIFAKTQNISEPRGPKYLCNECGYIFNTRLSILTHSKIHLKPFCLLCRKYTETVFHMELHMLTEHPSLIRFKQEPLSKTSMDVEQRRKPLNSNDLEETQLPGDFLKNLRNNGKQALVKPKRNVTTKCTSKNSSSKIKPLEQITKMVTSRFGRCITVKMPCF